MSVRKVADTWRGRPTVDGAGVHMLNAFSHDEVQTLDPFLMLAAFRSNRPEEYEKGFPFHPHRGIETITYIIEGQVEHADSMGNAGLIRAGDVQWMTAGRGIIHQEMPQGDEQRRHGGFQLWLNLPSRDKMSQPRYQEIKREQIPQVTTAGGAVVRVVCGEVEGTRGPIEGAANNPQYFDVSLAPGTSFRQAIPAGHTAFAYVFEGDGTFGEPGRTVPTHSLVLFEAEGDAVLAQAGAGPVRFLLVSGQPIREPIAWAGPIVMNTREELQQAFRELQQGTFARQTVAG